MKRLLLPLLAALALPTAVNAFPWGSDIVVKTDLGEKFIVKESAVNVTSMGVNDLIKLINEDGKKTKENFYKCNLIYGKDYQREKYMSGDSYCEVKYKMYSGKLTTQRSDITIAKNTEKNLHLKKVNFRPIFVDLNKTKIAYGYETVYCINPKLREQTIAIWDKYEKVKNYQPKKMTSSAYESMKVKVCEKYAKF